MLGSLPALWAASRPAVFHIPAPNRPRFSRWTRSSTPFHCRSKPAQSRSSTLSPSCNARVPPRSLRQRALDSAAEDGLGGIARIRVDHLPVAADEIERRNRIDSVSGGGRIVGKDDVL